MVTVALAETKAVENDCLSIPKHSVAVPNFTPRQNEIVWKTVSQNHSAGLKLVLKAVVL